MFGKVAFRIAKHHAHQPHTLPDHRIDDDVKQLCGQGSPLGHTMAGLEWTTILTLRPADVCCQVPEIADEVEHLWAYPI